MPLPAALMGAAFAPAFMAGNSLPTKTIAEPVTFSKSAAPTATVGTVVRNTDADFRAFWERTRDTPQRRRGPGWTNAHAQRLARKALNQRRHRAAVK